MSLICSNITYRNYVLTEKFDSRFSFVFSLNCTNYKNTTIIDRVFPRQKDNQMGRN